MKTTKKPKEDAVSLKLSVKEHGLEPILYAAYALTDRAWARVDGDRRKTLTVTLQPRDGKGLARLEGEFLAELAAQKLRWAVAKANVPVRLHIAQQAVLLAEGRLPEAPAAAPAADALTPEQQAEIDRLIAEVESEIKDLKTKKEGADPDNVRATWEERHREEG